MKLRALVVVLLIGLLVLPLSVSAIDNRDIALYPMNSVFVAAGCGSGSHVGIEIFNFEPISDNIYDWSYSIPVDENGTRYQTKTSSSYPFQWNCNNGNITIDVPITRIWGFYLMRASTESSQVYDVYMDGVLVASYNLNLNYTGSLIPLYNISNPFIITKGSHTITISHSSSVDSLRKFGYNYIVGVILGNASVPILGNVSIPNSTYYHNDFSVSIEANLNSTLEIYEAWVSINGENNQSLSTSGSFGFNASGIKDMMNNLTGVNNITVCMNDSYSNVACKEFNISILDAPDLVAIGVYPTENVTSGEDMNVLYEILNNGTVDVVDREMNITDDLDNVVYSEMVTIPKGERKNISFMWDTQGMAGNNRKLKLWIGNTANDRSDNHIFETSSFPIRYTRFWQSMDVKEVLTRITVEGDNGTILDNATANMSGSSIYLDPSLLGDWALVKFYYNSTWISLNDKDVNTLKIVRFNSTLDEYENVMSGSKSYIVGYGINTIDKYVWVNTTKFSQYGVQIDDYVAPPPSTPPPSGSSSSGGSIASLSKWWKHLNQYVIVVYDSIVDKPYAERILDKNPQAVLKSYDELTEIDKKQNLICVGGSQANRCTWDVNLQLDYPFRYLGNMFYDFVGDDLNSMAILGFAKNPYDGKYTRKTVLVLAGKTRVGTDKAVDYYLKNYLTLKESQNSRLI